MTEDIKIIPENTSGQESTQKESLQPDGGDVELIDLQSLEWVIDRNLKSVEYQKFYLGLSAGALVFSITFAQKIGPASEHSWIIIVGWISLLISIFCEISLIRTHIRQADIVHTMKGWVKEGKIDQKKIAQIIIPKDIISETYLKRVLLNDALVKLLVETLHSKRYEQMTHEELDIFRSQVIEDQELNKKVKKYLLKNQDKRLSHLAKIAFGFGTLSRRLRSEPLQELNQLKKALYATVIYDVVSLWFFYLGVVLISIYTIIRFIAK
ncbi:MAG: hypothetical protein ACLPX5_13235 [Dissulfurispiraceae bacterium]